MLQFRARSGSWNQWIGGGLWPVRPKAREVAQYGGPPGWLEESDPAGCDFVCDERSMPSPLTSHTICPVWGWSTTQCTQNTVMSYVKQGRPSPITIEKQRHVKTVYSVPYISKEIMMLLWWHFHYTPTTSATCKWRHMEAFTHNSITNTPANSYI